MSTVSGGIIHSLSVSQVEQFDSAQTGGCPRRWYLERVENRRPEQDAAQTEGDLGHSLLAHYLRTGEAPKGRVKMGKHVHGVIAKGELPALGPDLRVEERFDGQPKLGPDGKWMPLKQESTLWLGGVPWDGFVDLRYRRDGVVSIWDHKFSSDIHAYAKPADQLLTTVQMPVYALDALRIWPDAEVFQLVHHYVSRRGVDSFVRAQTVTVDQVVERRADAERLVAEMKQVARATSQEDVPFNRKSCAAWRGCPHQSVCTAYKENRLNLTKEELALFDDIDPQPEKAAAGAVERIVEIEPAALAEAVRDLSPAEKDRLRSITEVRVTSEDIPLPVASNPAAQPPPVCQACGTELNAENSSRKQDGARVHVGCPSAPIPDSQPKRRGRPPKEKPVESVNQARASAQALTGHTVGCVERDKPAANGERWICMPGCSAGAKPADAAEQAIAIGEEIKAARRATAANSIAAAPLEPEQSKPDGAAQGSATHPLAGVLTIHHELGPKTLALIERLLNR